MKIITLSLLLLLFPVFVRAQFEQKVSINLSSGIFKTFGPRTYKPVWATTEEDFEPSQMPNYKTGFMAQGGIQFNINRHISLETHIEMMYSGKWFYPAYDDVNYLDFAIYDQVTDELLASGSDELNFINLRIGIAPKYYLMPGNKLNPYLFLGFTMNYSSADFDDNQWRAYRDLDMLDIDDTGPGNPFLEKNLGIGFKPGIGAEYSFGDKLGVYLSLGMDYIFLNKNNFKQLEKKEDFMSFCLHTGIRFSFIKSKML